MKKNRGIHERRHLLTGKKRKKTRKIRHKPEKKLKLEKQSMGRESTLLARVGEKKT